MKNAFVTTLCFLFLFLSCQDNTADRLRADLQNLQTKEQELLQEKDDVQKMVEESEKKIEDLEKELDAARRSGDPEEILKLERKLEGEKKEKKKVLARLDKVEDKLKKANSETKEVKSELEREKRKSEAAQKAREEVDNLDSLDGPNDPQAKPAFFGYNCEDGKPLTYMEYYYYSVMIHSLHGTFTDPLLEDYGENLKGFNKYLSDVGVTDISAEELSLIGKDTPEYYTQQRRQNPNKPHKPIPTCKSLGIKNLMPPKKCWLRSAVLALLSERVGDRLKVSPEDLIVTSHYRPACYNQNVENGTASLTSDHILAKAIDLGIRGNRSKKEKFRKDVMKVVCDHFWISDDYRLSVGFGLTKIHLGIDSPRRRAGTRFWSYGGFDLKSVKGVNCFKK